ncbi:hypothetical protein AAFF_G00391650 [Aldrovandia affinis]|uniref:ribonuclease H n=1 Tax=Aldrovandia affinis TaxID=143900 RepID=A0AAD7WKY3_9TELE|nr:hypothetical protein AAFF_G00391650 [Aldrovandia affinis]
MDTIVAAMALPDKEIIWKNPRLASGPPGVHDDDPRVTYGSRSSLGRFTDAAMLLQEYLQKLLPQITEWGQDVLQEAIKKGGGFRLILNLRDFNRCLEVLKFKMLAPARVLKVISSGLWFTSLDLKDAYFHIPVHPVHWTYLRFAFEGVAFELKVLPFGLSLAPRTFTKCMDAVLAPLTAWGILILNDLDD